MAEYFDAIKIEMMLDGETWTDVSADVIAPIDVKQGVLSSDPLQRVANTGTMSFMLNNSASNSAGLLGYYAPSNANCRTGFDIGLPVRLMMTYDGREKCKFTGRIPANGINVIPGELGTRKTAVTVTDFMDATAKYEVELPQFTTNKTLSEIMTLLVADMPIKPEYEDYDTGDYTYAAVFDLVRPKTRLMQEFGALALSEMGYIYITHSWTHDEILKAESKSARFENPLLTELIINTSESGYLLMEDGGYLLQEDEDKLHLDELQSAWAIAESHMAMKTTYNNHYVNRVTAKVYPRQEDSENQILFSLQKPLSLDAGETREEYRVTFKDPTGGGARVTSRSMETPVATTDYTMNSEDDGTGDDLTADLSVTVTYGTNGAVYTLENTGETDGYITKLQARGKGIYTYDPIEYSAEDETSQAAVGIYNRTIDMKYQDDFEVAKEGAEFICSNYSGIGSVPETAQMAANLSAKHMWAFLQLEISDGVYVSETVTGIDSYYTINGYEFSILNNQHVLFTWHLMPSNIYGWQLDVDGRSELDLTTRIRR